MHCVEMLSEFSSGHICACYQDLGHFHLDGANLQMQTHLVPKTNCWNDEAFAIV